MKLNLPEPMRLGRKPARRTRQGERGSAVVVVLVLLFIMLIYVNANLKLLWQLDRELKLIEKKQLQKFENPAQTSLERTNVLQQSSAESRPTSK